MSAALLVPCYNAVRFLPRLRAQVDRLSPAFDEVLLADDSSQDDTAAVAASLGFTILRLPKNLGPGGARNALARMARSDWLHFHDVDDELAPDYLARVLPAAGAEIAAVLHYTDFIAEDDRSLLIRWRFSPAELASDPARVLLLNPLPTMSSFLRREVFLNLGGFNERLRCFEDGDLHYRLARSGARLAVVPEVLEWSLRRNDGAGSNQHYCFRCRLEFLESYTPDTSLHPALAFEAERAATMLSRFNDRVGARRAIALAERLGRRVPHTRHPLLRLVRPLLPALWLLRWQDRFRHTRH